MREASEGRMAIDTDSYAFFIKPLRQRGEDRGILITMILTVIYDLSFCGSNVAPNLSFLQFIPLVTLLLAGTGTIILAAKFFGTQGKSIGVLGMKEAGKTQLYRNLQDSPYNNSDEGTATDDYDSFTFKYGDREIIISAGRDIGGGEQYIKAYYAEMIKEKDIIFFVFNAEKYKSDRRYSDAVKSRMDFIWRHMKNKYIEDEIIRTKLVTIGSHLDKIDENKRSGVLEFFQNDVSDKEYSPMFHYNFIVADLTKREEFVKELIKNKIFG